MIASVLPLPEDSFAELHTLTTAVLNEELSDEQIYRLDRLVCEDENFRKLYIRYMYVSWNLRTWATFPLVSDAEDQLQPLPPDADAILLDQLANLDAEPAHGSAPGILATALHGTIGFFSQEIPFALLIATVVTGLGLLIGSLIHVSRPEQIEQIADNSSPMPTVVEPKMELVGRITGMVDCKWSKDGRAPYGNNNVLVGGQFKLTSGLMEITYDTGAKVILQGPVTYEVESKDSGFLSLGKLTARVEKKVVSSQLSVVSKSNIQHPTSSISNPQSLIPNPSSLSTIHYPLFTIKTPTATVTDLGTEFGVEVSEEGNTTSHVFRGKVVLAALGSRGEKQGRDVVLSANESARIEKNGGNQDSDDNRVTVFVTPAKLNDFVHAIPRENPKPTIKTFDLVDVVAGGDGFSGRRNAGIDPTNGRTTDVPPKPTDSEFLLAGDGHYHRVKSLNYVDGVFIPTGGAARVQVDSAGHTFSEFSSSVNKTACYLWAGGVIPPIPSEPVFPAVLGDVDYASPGHGLLWMHANKGITFDLEAIRRAKPNWKLLRFLAVAGNTETYSIRGGGFYADVWVLVDGQMRFRRREINGTNGAFPVDIPISKSDRFLTLAATDGGNGIAADWTIFGDPRLVLARSGVGDEMQTINTETQAHSEKGDETDAK